MVNGTLSPTWVAARVQNGLERRPQKWTCTAVQVTGLGVPCDAPRDTRVVCTTNRVSKRTKRLALASWRDSDSVLRAESGWMLTVR